MNKNKKYYKFFYILRITITCQKRTRHFSLTLIFTKKFIVNCLFQKKSANNSEHFMNLYFEKIKK